MIEASSLLRTLLIYSLCVPLAVFLGFLVTSPMDYNTMITLGVVLFLLTLPLFLRWHHLWLIASLNLGAVLFFTGVLGSVAGVQDILAISRNLRGASRVGTLVAFCPPAPPRIPPSPKAFQRCTRTLPAATGRSRPSFALVSPEPSWR